MLSHWDRWGVKMLDREGMIDGKALQKGTKGGRTQAEILILKESEIHSPKQKEKMVQLGRNKVKNVRTLVAVKPGGSQGEM